MNENVKFFDWLFDLLLLLLFLLSTRTTFILINSDIFLEIMMRPVHPFFVLWIFLLTLSTLSSLTFLNRVHNICVKSTTKWKRYCNSFFKWNKLIQFVRVYTQRYGMILYSYLYSHSLINLLLFHSPKPLYMQEKERKQINFDLMNFVRLTSNFLVWLNFIFYWNCAK